LIFPISVTPADHVANEWFAALVVAFIDAPVEPFCASTEFSALSTVYPVLPTNSDAYFPFVYVRLFITVPVAFLEYPVVVVVPFAFPPVMLAYWLLKLSLVVSPSIAFDPLSWLWYATLWYFSPLYSNSMYVFGSLSISTFLNL